MRTFVLATVAGLAAGPALAEPWEISVSPYVWMASVEGSLDLGRRTVDFDASFGDILRSLDLTAMGTVEARNGRWGLIGDFIYLDVSSDVDTPYGRVFTQAEVQVHSVIGTGAVAYRAYSDAMFDLDALAAFRVWQINTDTKLKSDRSDDIDFQTGDTWADPVIGARAYGRFGEHWFVMGESDVGGFGIGSELAWQALGVVGYRFDAQWTLQAGYRYMSVKRELPNGPTLQADFSGAILGFSYSF